MKTNQTISVGCAKRCTTKKGKVGMIIIIGNKKYWMTQCSSVKQSQYLSAKYGMATSTVIYELDDNYKATQAAVQAEYVEQQRAKGPKTTQEKLAKQSNKERLLAAKASEEQATKKTNKKITSELVQEELEAKESDQ